MPAARTIVLALVALAATTPAFAKPPWVAVELPADPMNSATRGAFLLVRAYLHGAPLDRGITGTATGTVDGRRQTLTLSLDPTNMPGVFALRRTWPAGPWVLALNAGGPDGATALVGVGSNGAVRSIRVPTTTTNGFTAPRRVTDQDISVELQALARAEPGAGGLTRGAATAAALAAGLVLVGSLRRKRN